MNSKNFLVPELAIVPKLLIKSSCVIPTPLSEIVKVLVTGSVETWIVRSKLDNDLSVKERYLTIQSQTFFFHVQEAGDSVRIEWDQNAAAIRNAHVGAIDVKDGGGTKRYALGDQELQSGQMLYKRQGGDLEIRMTVYPVGFNPVQQFAHFLDPGSGTPASSAPTGPPAEVEQLRQERDRLEMEVKQLKENLRKEQALRRRRR